LLLSESQIKLGIFFTWSGKCDVSFDEKSKCSSESSIERSVLISIILVAFNVKLFSLFKFEIAGVISVIGLCPIVRFSSDLIDKI
jgi:hypothetical protein